MEAVVVVGCGDGDGPVAFRVVFVVSAAREIFGVEQGCPAGLVGRAPVLEYEQDAGCVINEGILDFLILLVSSVFLIFNEKSEQRH